MRKTPFLLAILICLSLTAFAQPELCGTDQLHDRLLTQNAAYAQSMAGQRESWIQHNPASNKIIAGPKGAIYELPVVVHIIHSGEAVGTVNNPTDQQIQSWIDYCNQTYSARSSLFADTLNGGIYIPIRLKLAARDAACNASTGIERIDGSVVPNYATDGVQNSSGTGPGISDSAVKSLSDWPYHGYVNIWLVKKIANGGTLGYATFPGTTPSRDGLVIAALCAQPNFFSNPTLPHELGHYLGLLHTFQGDNGGTACPVNSNCTADGDGICDTEPHLMPWNICPSGMNACTGANYTGVQFNHMNYSSCRNRFTAGQREKMLFSLLNYRYGLLTSLGTTSPGNITTLTPPANLCVPSGISYPNNNLNTGIQNVTLADMRVTTQGYTYDDNRFYWDHTVSGCVQPQSVAHLHKDSSYTLTVTTGPNMEYVRGWIDFNNDGVFSTAELVISSNGSASYQSHSGTVTIPSSATLCTPLRMRIASDLFGLTPQPCGNPQFGQTEDFIVVVNSQTATAAIIASPGTNVSSGQVVTFTATATNGGNNPQYQWRRNGQAITGATASTWSATAGSGFLSGDAITVLVTSNATCTQPGPVSSNALTMQVGSTGVGRIGSNRDAVVALYPNPNRGSFTVDGFVTHPGEYEMRITNALGQDLFAQSTTTAGDKLHAEIALKAFPAGAYLLTLYSQGETVKRVKFTVAD